MAKEQEATKQAAKELEQREKQASKELPAKSGRSALYAHFTRHIGQFYYTVLKSTRRHSCGQHDMLLNL